MTSTPTLEQIDPTKVVIDDNIRADADVKSILANIKQHGITTPILVRKVGDTHHLIDGQRRVLAAIQLGHATILANVYAGEVSLPDSIIEQINVNLHRLELSDTDRVNAVHKLTLFGLSADAIRRKTNLPEKYIKTAAAVADSPVATTAIAEHHLTLDEAAVVLEFEDSTDDVAALAAASKDGQFNHEAARIRQRRADEELYTAEAERATAAGYPIVAAPEYDNPTAKRIGELYASEQLGARITTAEHTACPGRAVYIRVFDDWTDDRQRIRRAVTTEVCTDWKANGHFTYSSSTGSTSAGNMTDKEKAERKLTRENNKLWAPATEVRLEFVTELLQRKETPAGWADFFADLMTARQYLVDAHSVNRGAHFLGATDSARDWYVAHPTTSATLLLAIALAAYENQAEFAKSGWRNRHAAVYLAQLSKWGYALSELEERVVAGTATEVI